MLVVRSSLVDLNAAGEEESQTAGLNDSAWLQTWFVCLVARARVKFGYVGKKQGERFVQQEVGEGLHSIPFLLLTQWPRVRFLVFTKIYFNGAEIYLWAGWRKVGRGLKILIKPIKYWLVASQYYKKDLFNIWHSIRRVNFIDGLNNISFFLWWRKVLFISFFSFRFLFESFRWNFSHKEFLMSSDFLFFSFVSIFEAIFLTASNESEIIFIYYFYFYYFFIEIDRLSLPTLDEMPRFRKNRIGFWWWPEDWFLDHVLILLHNKSKLCNSHMLSILYSSKT